jgi:hypothetical protein
MLWPRKPPSPSESPDRRATARLDKVFPVWVDGERGGCHGVARNISRGGLFVETPVTHPIGSQVRITFSAGGEEMTAVGEVRYLCHLVGRPASPSPGPVGVRGMGLRFLYFEPPPGSRAAPH